MNKQKGISSIVVMVAMLVMAVALPITTKLVQQNQENRSKAADSCSKEGAGWFTSQYCSTTQPCTKNYYCTNGKDIDYDSNVPKTDNTCTGMCSSGKCSGGKCVAVTTTIANAKCGSADGTKVDSKPKTSILCDTTTAAPVWVDSTAANGQYIWDCVGLDNKTTAKCSATKITTTTIGVGTTCISGTLLTEPRYWYDGGSECSSGEARNCTGCANGTKACYPTQESCKGANITKYSMFKDGACTNNNSSYSDCKNTNCYPDKTACEKDHPPSTETCDSIPSSCNSKNFIGYKVEGDFNCSGTIDINDFILLKGWVNSGKDQCGTIEKDFIHWKTSFNASN